MALKGQRKKCTWCERTRLIKFMEEGVDEGAWQCSDDESCVRACEKAQEKRYEKRSMTVALDPGVKEAGVAVFIDGTLDVAWLAQGKEWIETASDAFEGLYRSKCEDPVRYKVRVVVERPQVYQQRKLKGDPNDLVSVALMAGAFAGFMKTSAYRAEVAAVYPRDWKGQVDKDAMIERIKGKLSKEEARRVELPRRKKLQHNVWDAVGIGLWAERTRRQKR